MGTAQKGEGHIVTERRSHIGPNVPGSRDVLEALRRDGVVKRADAKITPLPAGVSSDIFRVDDGHDVFVVKRALQQLKVRDQWLADISRNRYERAFIEYVGKFMPEAMPSLRFTPPGCEYFAMEYLGPGFLTWKQLLLCGDIHAEHAVRAATVLGRIHAHSYHDQEAERLFDTTKNFIDLRIDPYLLTTGKRHPDLYDVFREEARRLAATRQCLVHGDFSPKNIMVSAGRLVLLDCEVGWYGDPAFDVGFMLTHLLLKSIYHAPAPNNLAGLAAEFWRRYITETEGVLDPRTIEKHVVRLLPMLLLARIDGKSPVEYLIDSLRKDWVRRFARSRILEEPAGLDAMLSEWFGGLANWKAGS